MSTKTITLKKSEWLHGQDANPMYRAVNDESGLPCLCAMGIIAVQCGIPKESLVGHYFLSEIKGLWSRLSQKPFPKGIVDNQDTIAFRNDNKILYSSIDERVTALNNVPQKRFKFVYDPNN